MLYIPNSAEGKCLTEKENHTLCLKSDRKPKNLRMTKNVMVRNSPTLPTMLLLKTADLCFLLIAHDQYTYPLARPLLIALQVARTSFGFHLMGSSFPPWLNYLCEFRAGAAIPDRPTSTLISSHSRYCGALFFSFSVY